MKNTCKSCGQDLTKIEGPGPAHAPTAPGAPIGHEAPSREQLAKSKPDWVSERDAVKPVLPYVMPAMDGPAEGYVSVTKEDKHEQSPGSGGDSKELKKTEGVPAAKPKLIRPLSKAGMSTPMAKPPGGKPTPDSVPMSTTKAAPSKLIRPLAKTMTASGPEAVEDLAKAKMSPEAMSHAASDSYKAAQAQKPADAARTGLTQEDHSRRAAEFASFTTPSHAQVGGHGTSFAGAMSRPKLPRRLG